MVFTLVSCGGLSGTYEGTLFDLKFSGSKVTVIAGENELKGTYKIEEDDGNKTITFDFVDEDEATEDEKEVLELINNDTTPILVWVDSGDNVWGYCFCCIQYTKGNSVLADVKTLYIDDLCVDKSKRGLGIGKELYQSAKALAKDLGCYNLTLNVWEFEGSAKGFYQKQGLKTQKTVMEEIL